MNDHENTTSINFEVTSRLQQIDACANMESTNNETPDTCNSLLSGSQPSTFMIVGAHGGVKHRKVRAHTPQSHREKAVVKYLLSPSSHVLSPPDMAARSPLSRVGHTSWYPFGHAEQSPSPGSGALTAGLTIGTPEDPTGHHVS